MIGALRRTLHPAWYQGCGKKAPYFEGWYVKLVDPGERHRLAVIPGIFKGNVPGESHAFIQLLDGTSGEATYHRYPVEAFQSAAENFDLQLGDSRFSLERVVLDIESLGRSVTGRVAFEGISPWPVTLTSPGVMGWFAWIPFLQTYHGVLSLDHVLHGALTIDGQEVDFSGGRGYIEKDWGRSFPDAWIWMQTNHFDRPGTSLTASMATIPWLGTSFRGFIIGLWHRGRLYRFATYTGARIEELAWDGEQARAVIVDRHYRLEIAAHGAETGELRGPTGSSMAGRVPESLQASVTVRLSALDRDGSSLLFAGLGRNAGLEVVGDTARLLV
jgi:hypothetical protein